jgi:uncharacterized membrane-anchored protein
MFPRSQRSQRSQPKISPRRATTPGEKQGEATFETTVRMGRRTKALIPTLKPGAIVIIDHADLDAVAAHGLAQARPKAVINNQSFITGKYPNKGPNILLEAGIALYESPLGIDLFTRFTEGESVVLESDSLHTSSRDITVNLAPLGRAELTARLQAARANLDTELCRFAENTLEYLQRDGERDILLGNVDLPEIQTPIAGKPVLVVVRGEGYEKDLARLAPYVREQRPVIIAVDGAADALLEFGMRPQIILGDMDSISDAALKCGAELVVHAYTDGRAPGAERVKALGLVAKNFPIAGTSEDAALLLAYERDAKIIVAVGTHTNLEDFLDKGRGGMASTFLVRLKVGNKLVDARGVSHLYTSRTRSGPLLVFLAVSAIFPLLIFLIATPQGQVAWRSFLLSLRLR